MASLKLRAISIKSGSLFAGVIAVLLAAVIFKPFAIINAGERVAQLENRLANYGLIVDDSLVNFAFFPEFNKAIKSNRQPRS